MDSGPKVRVVCCPKCKMLLPEPPNTPIYRCGGCNATLQAKNRLSTRSDASSEKSDYENIRVRGSFENSSEKEIVASSEMSETNREGDWVELSRKESVLPERRASSSSSSYTTANRDTLNDVNDSRAFESKPFNDRNRYINPSKASVENWINSEDVRSNLEGLIEKYTEEKRTSEEQVENTAGFHKFGQIMDTPMSGKTSRAVQRPNFPHYSDEGPSNYHLDSAHRYGEQVKNQNQMYGSDKVDSLEQERAELLRQLDELRNRLARTVDVSGQSRERVFPSNRRMAAPNPYDGQNAWYTEGPSMATRGNQIRRPPYFDHNPAPLKNRSDLDVRNFYASMYSQNGVLGYPEPLGPQMARRAFQQVHHQFSHHPQGPPNRYRAGQYMETHSNAVAAYPQNAVYEQSTCACSHCYHNRHCPVAPQVPLPIFHNEQLLNAASSDMLYHLDGLVPHALEGYNHGGANLPVQLLESLPHARKPSDIELDMGGFRRPHLQRVVLTKGKARSCQPLAGGAPFATCCNCFELLRLPKKLLTIGKNQLKLRCGACSKVISCTLDGRRLIFSIPSSPEQVESDSGNVIKESLSLVNQNDPGIIDCYSDDSNASSYINQSTGTKPTLSPSFPLGGDNTMGQDHLLNLSELGKMQELSSASRSSKGEKSPDNIATPRHVPESTGLTLKVDVALSVPSSPLREHFEYSPTNLSNRSGKGSRSQRSDREKIFPMKGISRENSVIDAPAATETDCSFTEFSNSHDSEEITEELIRPRFRKSRESFFVGFLKKSLRDFSKSSQSLENSRSSVSVNGKPIPDSLVRKAEKRAGPIQPGNYWYDYRAGFWGVMGYPCLGIIPPFIEEFNHPMPKNCAAGDSGVFINGRELHQKDLDLLASRGLPTTTDKSYVVEISGRIFDETTGEELRSLGKLAPTVQKVNHGFGMRVPRSMA